MNKKITTTKLLLFLNYIAVFLILAKLFQLVDCGADISVIATFGTVLSVFAGMCGYSIKWYYWKAKAENVYKIHLGLIDEMLNKQLRNPRFKVFDEYDIRQEKDTLINSLKYEEGREVSNAVSEDVTTQIY